MVGLDEVEAPVDGLEVVGNFFVIAEGVGEDADAEGVAAVDEVFREDFPAGVDGVGMEPGGDFIQFGGVAQGREGANLRVDLSEPEEVGKGLIDDGAFGHAVTFHGGGERFRRNGLGVEVEVDAAFHGGEELVEGGQAQISVGAPEFEAGAEGLNDGGGGGGDGAVAAGLAVEGAVVEEIKVTVAGGADIELDVIRAEPEGFFEGGQGVFRRVAAGTAMKGKERGARVLLAPEGMREHLFGEVGLEPVRAGGDAPFPEFGAIPISEHFGLNFEAALVERGDD